MEEMLGGNSAWLIIRLPASGRDGNYGRYQQLLTAAQALLATTLARRDRDRRERLVLPRVPRG